MKEKVKVKAVILVGGQGTRLRPLTYNVPKPMIPVLNIPFLEHIIRNLKEHQITDIILAQHYLAESMSHYFGDGSTLGVRLIYVTEDSPKGTAGGVKNVERYLDSTFLVLNGDTFHDLDFTRMIEFHRRHNAKVTIALTPIENPTNYGIVETNRRGRVKQFLEKPKPEEVTTNLINAGTYIMEPDVLKWIPHDVQSSVERELFPKMLSAGKSVYAFLSNNYWIDTGTPEKYLQLHRDLLNGKCEKYIFSTDKIIGKDCIIHPSTQFSGKVIIGDNCRIDRGVKLSGPVVVGPNCSIGEDVSISDSVIWHNNNIDSGVTIESSVIADNCVLGHDSCLIDVVLGDHVTVSAHTKLKPGSRILPGEAIQD